MTDQRYSACEENLAVWDTHCHIFDPANFPYEPGSPYHPPPASTTDLVRASPAANFVLVMSVPEGNRTGLLLKSIRELEAMGRRARGTAVLDIDQLSTGDLRNLHAAGVRSVRLHEARVQRRLGPGLDALARAFEEIAMRIAPLGWSIDAQLPLATWAKLAPTLRMIHESYGTRVVADHLFCATPADYGGRDFQAALDLVRAGGMYVKISGLDRFRLQTNGGSVHEMRSLVLAAIESYNGERVLFGSDWPHVSTVAGKPSEAVDLTVHLAFLKACCADAGEGTWRKLMQSNAEALHMWE